MSKKDQMLLEEIYSRQVVEKLDEPEFVQKRPHPAEPLDGTQGVNNLIKQPEDQERLYQEAARKILDGVLKKDHKVNMAVLQRDNFGNVNLDPYKESITQLVTYMQHHHDNTDLVHAAARNLAKSLLPQIEQITNRFDYNPETEISNMGSMQNDNAKKPYTGKQFAQESTLNYLSAKFDPSIHIVNETHSSTINTLSYLGKR